MSVDDFVDATEFTRARIDFDNKPLKESSNRGRRVLIEHIPLKVNGIASILHTS